MHTKELLLSTRNDLISTILTWTAIYKGYYICTKK
jgi:hypothetical protein